MSNLIYHHTTAEGILGILSSNSIHATNIDYLNDHKEYHVGVACIKDFINSEITRTRKLGPEGEVYENFYNIIARTFDQNTSIRLSFVASFTRVADSLRHWLSYGKPNNCYAIAFDADMISKKAKRTEIGIISEYQKVEYSGSNWKPITLDYENIKSNVTNLVKSTQGSDRDEKIMRYAYELMHSLLVNCCTIKPNEFQDEHEERIIVRLNSETHSNAVSHKIMAGMIVSYLPIEIDKSAVKKIVIGPNSNMELAKRGINSLLNKLEMQCEVVTSECSLRQF